MPFKLVIYKKPTLVDMGVDTVRTELLNETRAIGREMKRDLEQAFVTWSERPEVKMAIHLTRTDAQAGVEVYTDDPVVNMLNWGTKRHFVAPVRAPRLAWQVGFSPKTVPGQLRSIKGGKFGNVWATSMGHMISGVEPRRWDEALRAKWDKPIVDRLQAAANRGAAKARRV